MAALLTLATLSSVSTFQSTQLQCALYSVYNLKDKPLSGLILHADNDKRAQDAANEISQLLSRSTTLKTALFTTLKHIKYPGYTHISKVGITIWIISPNDFLQQVKIVRENLLWKPSMKTILIIQDNETDIVEIFLALWEGARAVNVVAISVNNELFTWYPYAKHKCNSNITSVSIGKCDYNTFTETALFPEKIKSDLNNCPVSAVTRTIYPYVGLDETTLQPNFGIEFILVHTTIKKYHGTVQYKQLPEGAIFYGKANENPYGAFAMLKNYEVDLIYASLFDSDGLNSYSDTIYPPHTNDELIWLIPQPQKIPPFKNLYMAFESEIWVSVILGILCISATMYISDILTQRIHQLGLPTINALAITLNLSISPLPKTRIMKSLMIVCFIYGVHVATAYQSSLFSFLTRPIKENAISSVKEAIDRGMLVSIFAALKPYIFQDGFPYQEYILSHPHEFVLTFGIEKLHKFDDKILFGTKLSLLFYFFHLKKVDEYNVPLVRALNPGVFSFYITLFFARGHPLKPKFDLTMQQMLESGLKEKWMEDYIEKYGGKNSGIDSQSPLNVNSLSGAFLILCFGLSIAITIFLCETIYNWVIKKTLKENATLQKRRVKNVLPIGPST